MDHVRAILIQIWEWIGLYTTFLGNIFSRTCGKLEYVFTFATTIGKRENTYPNFSIESIADVAKLVDALDLGSSAARHGGSSPSIRTAQALNLSTVRKTGKRLGVFNSTSV
jgi:hypothetical protein